MELDRSIEMNGLLLVTKMTKKNFQWCCKQIQIIKKYVFKNVFKKQKKQKQNSAVHFYEITLMIDLKVIWIF